MKIIILDFFIGGAFVYYDYDPDKYENAEDFLIEKGHIPENCEWMSTLEPIIIY